MMRRPEHDERIPANADIMKAITGKTWWEILTTILAASMVGCGIYITLSTKVNASENVNFLQAQQITALQEDNRKQAEQLTTMQQQLMLLTDRLEGKLDRMDEKLDRAIRR